MSTTNNTAPGICPPCPLCTEESASITLNLADGRTFFCNECSTEFEIARGPASGIILGVTFVGAPLTASITFDYRQGLGTPQLNVPKSFGSYCRGAPARTEVNVNR